MRLRNTGLFFLLIILSTTILLVQPAHACSPTEPPPEGAPAPIVETLESRVYGSSVIFEGTVTAISEDRALTTVQVSRYFKGNGPGSVTVLGFGWGTDCLPVTNIGEHAIFYTSGDPVKELSISSWGSVEFVDDANVDAIVKLVGHEPVLVPGEPVLMSEPPLPVLVIVVSIGLGIIIIVIIAALIWLKQKPKEA